MKHETWLSAAWRAEIVALVALVLYGCATAPRPPKPGPISSVIHPTARTLAPLVAVAALTNQNVTFAWDKVPDPTATGYKLYYGSGPRAYTNSIDAGTNVTDTVSNLVSGRTYYFAATAYNAAGFESAFSNEVIVSPVAPPTNLRITLVLQTSLNPSGPFIDAPVAPIILTNGMGDMPNFYRLSIATTPIP